MKTRKICLLACLGGGLLLASASASAVNLIVNGDFHTGALAPQWTTFTTANGMIIAPAVTSFDVTGTGVSSAAVFEVGQVTFVAGAQAGGGVFQNFVSAGGAFTGSVDIAARTFGGLDNAEAGVFSVLLDGVTQASHAFGYTTVNTTVRSSLTFSGSLSAGSHELRILITRPFSANITTPFQYIDNIVLDDGSTVVPVPEPSALMLFGIGLGGLKLAGRRKRQASV